MDPLTVWIEVNNLQRRPALWSALSGADAWVFTSLLVLVIWAPLPLGSARPWAGSLLAVLSLLLAAVWVAYAFFGKVTLPKLAGTHWLLATAGLLWWLWVGFYCLPLPEEVVARLSPVAHQHYQAADEYLARAATYRLSLETGATYRQWLLTSGLLSFGALTVACVNSRARKKVFMWTIVLMGLMQALFGAFMEISNIELEWFGSVVNGPLGASGTYVNRNHFAGCLEIALAVGIGLMVSRLSASSATTWRARARAIIDLLLSEKIRLRVILVAMVVALLLSRSRMGNIAFFVSLASCGLFYIALRERRLFFKSLLLFASILIVDAIIVGQWYGLDKVVERIEQTEAGREMRVVSLPDLTHMARQTEGAGIGLGSFYALFPRYRTEVIYKRFQHAHNDYLQFYIETGWVGLLLLAIMIGSVVTYAVRLILNRRDRLVCGIGLAGFMAFTAIGMHSFVDFNLQIPANAFLLCAVAGLVLSCSQKSHSAEIAQERDRKRMETARIEADAVAKV